jgi:hypothetical protein
MSAGGFALGWRGRSGMTFAERSFGAGFFRF